MVIIGRDLKPGVVLRIDNAPCLVQKTETTLSGGNSSIIKTNLKNLWSGRKTEKIYFSEDQINDFDLDFKAVLLSAINGDSYTFMDIMDHSKYEVSGEDIEGVLPYIEEGMSDICRAVFFEGTLVTIELPTKVSRKVSYVDPSMVYGALKRAQLDNGTHIMVAGSVGVNDMTVIDTRRGSLAGTL